MLLLVRAPQTAESAPGRGPGSAAGRAGGPLPSFAYSGPNPAPRPAGTADKGDVLPRRSLHLLRRTEAQKENQEEALRAAESGGFPSQ